MKFFKFYWKPKLLIFFCVIITFPCVAQEVEPCDSSTESKIRIINSVAPTFPTNPYDNKILEGFVKLQFEVNSSGLVQNVMILESIPKRFFDITAIKAIRKSKFSTSNEPELRCGIITYDFKLE